MYRIAFKGFEPCAGTEDQELFGTREAAAAWLKANHAGPDVDGVTCEFEVEEADNDAIEAALRNAGATAEEAEALTDILHEEGWGGKEHEPMVDLERMIEWYRESRA